MQHLFTSRTLSLIALGAFVTSGLATSPLHAQQAATNFPSSAPTNGITSNHSSEHPASVTYKDGRLAVVADNSSLTQILNAISRLTGMKVTGAVADEHVFGNYGPDDPAKVLADLLDGTSCNVLIQQNLNRTPGVAPIELVLTPRGGPASPPNPHPQPFDNGPRQEPVNPYPVAQPTPAPPQPPAATAPTQPPATTAPNGIQGAYTPGTPIGTDSNTAGSNGGSNSSSSTDPNQQQSPNGVKTPQQIYEQLQQLRQQQQQQQQSQQNR